MSNFKSQFINLFQVGKDVKVIIDGKSVTEPIKRKHYKNHLNGHKPLGVDPLCDNGTCRWVAINFDFIGDPDRSTRALKESTKFRLKLIELGIKCSWLERTESETVRLWIYFSDPVPYKNPRKWHDNG